MAVLRLLVTWLLPTPAGSPARVALHQLW
jgi:hypothetical protein